MCLRRGTEWSNIGWCELPELLDEFDLSSSTTRRSFRPAFLGVSYRGWRGQCLLVGRLARTGPASNRGGAGKRDQPAAAETRVSLLGRRRCKVGARTAVLRPRVVRLWSETAQWKAVIDAIGHVPSAIGAPTRPRIANE